MTTIKFILLLYIIISGVIFASYCYDKKEGWFNIIIVFTTFFQGSLVVPMLIGRVLNKIMEE